ncbi:MAG: hypothetical protein KAH86_10250, partial [Methanosarcinales archaeon]|nr:hypothetical protein [Methanosarcinales archaeon]
YVTDSASIDLTSESNIAIPAGVTLASGRGRGGSLGALLYANHIGVPGAHTIFESGGEGIRITGLRIDGRDYNMEGAGGSWSKGIFSKYNIEVDNNELFGFSHAAVNLKSAFVGSDSHIHHNYIHHNTQTGLGYGVAIDTPLHENADVMIEANLFDWNRHSIASSGRPTVNYIARYNVQLGNGTNHAFDVHGDGADASHVGGNAGNTILIYGNTFYPILSPSSGARQLGVNIRGVPVNKAEVYDNYFYDTRYAAIRQRDWNGNTITDYNYINMFVHDNCYSCNTLTGGT